MGIQPGIWKLHLVIFDSENKKWGMGGAKHL